MNYGIVESLHFNKFVIKGLIRLSVVKSTKISITDNHMVANALDAFIYHAHLVKHLDSFL